MRIDIFKDNISYVTDEVSSIPTYLCNFNQEYREKFVTDLAAISRGKLESSNSKARYKALLTEAATNSNPNLLNYKGTPSRPMEFIGIKTKIYHNGTKIIVNDTIFTFEQFNNWIGRFSYIENDILYTNLRCLLNAGIYYEAIPYNDNIAIAFNIKINSNNKRVKNCIINQNTIENFYIDLDTFRTLNMELYYLFDKIELHNNVIYGIISYSRLLKYFNIESYDVKSLLLNKAIDNKEENNVILLGLKDSIDSINHFKAIRVKSPMFVWSQLMTHTSLSKESQSDRVTKQLDYWLPSDIFDRIEEFDYSKEDEYINRIITDIKIKLVDVKDYNKDKKHMLLFMFNNIYSQNTVQDILRVLGYKREIYSRAPYYFKYKELIMTGWLNDEKTWLHLFRERNASQDEWKNWTQQETEKTVKAIKKVIYKG